jgi:molybdate transport repressor ModE-like protein
MFPYFRFQINDLRGLARFPSIVVRTLSIFVHLLLEVHFRVAWRKLQEMEDRLGTKLTERTTGGPRDGGTRLTAKGLDCVRRFRRLTAGLQDLIEQRFAEAFEES